MTTRTQQAARRRWVLPFLAALVAILATILSSASASAATTAGAETRVRAINVAGEVLVEPPQHITAGQRLGNDVPQAEIVVATGVAANGAADVGAATNKIHSQECFSVWAKSRVRCTTSRVRSMARSSRAGRGR